MLKLKIFEINNYNYILLDDENKKYNLNIEFYGFIPQVNDLVYIYEKNIKENILYTYGPVGDKYTKNEYEDIIKIERDNKYVYLQRYYG